MAGQGEEGTGARETLRCAQSDAGECRSLAAGLDRRDGLELVVVGGVVGLPLVEEAGDVVGADAEGALADGRRVNLLGGALRLALPGDREAVDDVVGPAGLAGGDVHEIARYLALGVFDVLLVHNRWTLVDRSAGPLIAEAHRQGMGVLNAAVYGGGILAHQDAAGSPTSYGYRPASQPLLDAVESMRAVCARYGADLPTAALRFSVRDDGFASTIVGMSRPERVPVTVAAAQAALPDDLFAELETLLPAPEHWLDAPL